MCFRDADGEDGCSEKADGGDREGGGHAVPVGYSADQERRCGADDSASVVGEAHSCAADCGGEELAGDDGEAAEIACSPEAD